MVIKTCLLIHSEFLICCQTYCRHQWLTCLLIDVFWYVQIIINSYSVMFYWPLYQSYCSFCWVRTIGDNRSRFLRGWVLFILLNQSTEGNVLSVCVAESYTTVVYRCLVSNVPCGHTISYGDLARLSGSVKASRAVGQAMRRNPVPLLIPCHRVIRSNGQAGHYSGGQRDFLKQWLLMLEKSRTW